MPRLRIDEADKRPTVGDGIEIVSSPLPLGDWETRIEGGLLDGLTWRSTSERQAVDRHVLLTRIARECEEL